MLALIGKLYDVERQAKQKNLSRLRRGLCFAASVIVLAQVALSGSGAGDLMPRSPWNDVYLSSGNRTAPAAAEFAGNRSIFRWAAVTMIGPRCYERSFTTRHLGVAMQAKPTGMLWMMAAARWAT